MADDIRIKDLQSTASYMESDDYLPIDGLALGNRKIPFTGLMDSEDDRLPTTDKTPRGAITEHEGDISEIKQSLSDLGDATLLHTFTAVDTTGVSVDFTSYRTALVVVYDGTWGYMASSYYPIDLFLTAENHWARSQWGNSVVSGAVRYVNSKLQCLYLESGGLSAVVCRVYGLK